MKTSIFRRIGGIYSKRTVENAEKKLRYSGGMADAVEWLGIRLIFSILIGLSTALIYLDIYYYVNPLILVAMFFAGFFLTQILLYLKTYFAIANRTSRMEKILPDFLMLVVSNLRAGLTPFSAFVNAARPEFGELHHEVKIAAGKTAGKGSLDDALVELSTRFDSDILRRVVSLFGKGVKSGGRLANLLNSSSDEVRKIQDLRLELITTTRMYTIFLGFIVIILMPFLLAISTHFITMFISIQSDIETGTSGLESMGNIPTIGGKLVITVEEVTYTSIAALFVTSLLVSILIGIISRGKVLYGVKYFPMFFIASSIVFIAMKALVGEMLSAFAI